MTQEIIEVFSEVVDTGPRYALLMTKDGFDSMVVVGPMSQQEAKDGFDANVPYAIILKMLPPEYLES